MSGGCCLQTSVLSLFYSSLPNNSHIPSFNKGCAHFNASLLWFQNAPREKAQSSGVAFRMTQVHSWDLQARLSPLSPPQQKTLSEIQLGSIESGFFLFSVVFWGMFQSEPLLNRFASGLFPYPAVLKLGIPCLLPSRSTLEPRWVATGDAFHGGSRFPEQPRAV